MLRVQPLASMFKEGNEGRGPRRGRAVLETTWNLTVTLT
jgi:hypothetical protein